MKNAAIVRWNKEERGSMSIASAGVIIVALIVFLPMVWNLGAVRTVRRHSQNSSDAAALAAAESIARELNRVGQCVPAPVPPTDLQRHVLLEVAPIGNSGVGSGAAQHYAASNRGTLRSYEQHLVPMAPDGVHAQLVDGAVFPPTRVHVQTSVPISGILVAMLYGGEGEPVTSQASAEVYLAKVRVDNVDREPDALSRYLFRNTPACPTGAGSVYTLRWRVRLVPTGL